MVRLLGGFIAAAAVVFLISDYLETILQFVQMLQDEGVDWMAATAATGQLIKFAAFYVTFFGVLAAMKRQGAEGEFRSNLHRGGSARLIKITPEERSTAVRAAKAMGLNVCGLDLLRSNHGPVIMEVNSSPGLEGIETATGKDIAGQIIEFIEANAKKGNTKTKGKG